MTTIPTTQQLFNSILADLEGELGVQTSTVGKVYIRSLASVQAAKLKLLYLSLGFIQRNVGPDTADSEFNGGTLERWGRIKLNRNPFSEIAGEYIVDVTGTIGAVIPAGTQFKSNDTSLSPGYLFILDSAYTLIATTDQIQIRALTAGINSVLAVSDTLTATAPIALADRAATVSSIVTPAQAAESISLYRSRVIDAFRLEPQGGAAADYRLWAADVQGVRQTYVFSTSGATNEVDVYVEATDDASFPIGSGIPTSSIITDVQDAIDLDPDTSRPIQERARRPVQVIVNVIPITPNLVDVEIVGFVNLTAAIQNTITEAISIYVDSIRPFVDAADVLSDINDVISVNGLIFTIQDAVQGANFTSINLIINGTPVSSMQLLLGNISKINSVTFI